MNITEYIYLINKPEAIHEKQTAVLEKIVQEFPYFQSARALYLKGLYNQNSFKYNYVLKVAAAHTADRSILFDFITSYTFTSIHKDLLEQKLSEIAAITVSESEIVEPKLEIRENTVEQSILSSIKEAGQNAETFEIPAERSTEEGLSTMEPEQNEPIQNFDSLQFIKTEEIEIPAEIIFEHIPETPIAPTPEASEDAEQTEDSGQPDQTRSTAEISEANLEIGKPLEFSRNETHSFQEWLQLSKFQPIDRSEPESASSEDEQSQPTETSEENNSDPDLEKQKKKELIDRFIQTSPKIPPVKHDAPLSPSAIVEPSMADKSYLMTETLARVYLEQKKYNKAIQAYEILILKYPEKSSFFADRILDIKNLQHNNK